MSNIHNVSRRMQSPFLFFCICKAYRLFPVFCKTGVLKLSFGCADKFVQKGWGFLKADIDIISRLPVFAGLPGATVARILEYAEVREFPQGTTIIQQDANGKEFFVLIQGHAQVARTRPNGTTVQVSILSAGDAFGEMALIEGTRRTATVKAIDRVEAIVIPKKYFDLIFLHGSKERKSLTDNLRKIANDSQQGQKAG